jgi:hypothetical protein
VLADLACAIADGGEVISDFRVIGDQGDLFGRVASVPTAWRTLDEIARDGRALGKIGVAVNAARRRAWAGIAARHGVTTDEWILAAGMARQASAITDERLRLDRRPFAVCISRCGQRALPTTRRRS